MLISGLEAHLLLYALDHYCATDRRGTITISPPGYWEEMQDLRDRLFAIHEHPPEEDNG